MILKCLQSAGYVRKCMYSPRDLFTFINILLNFILTTRLLFKMQTRNHKITSYIKVFSLLGRLLEILAEINNDI